MFYRLRYAARRVRDYSRRFGLRGPFLMARLYTLYLSGSVKPVFVRLYRDGAGIWLRPALDLGIFHQVFVEGEYDFEFSEEPATIIDAGANIGCASIFFAHRFPNATIISVEPMPSTYALLERNVGNLDNVRPLHAALWNDDARIEIVDDSVHHLAVQVRAESGAGRLAVSGRSIASIAEEAGFDSISLLKLDIEGAEQEIFAAPREWIDRVNAIIIEFHDDIRPGSEAEIRQVITDHWPFDEVSLGENVCLQRVDTSA